MYYRIIVQKNGNSAELGKWLTNNKAAESLANATLKALRTGSVLIERKRRLTLDWEFFYRVSKPEARIYRGGEEA